MSMVWPTRTATRGALARIPPRALAGAAFATIALVWGSTLYAIKIGHGGTTPLMGAALRFLVAGLVLLGALAVTRTRLPRGAREWTLTAFIGIVMFGIDYGFLYWGSQHVASGVASVVFGTTTFWSLLVAASIGLERVTPRKLVGLALGLAGLVAVVAGSGADAGDGTTRIVGAASVLGAAVTAAIATVAMRRFARDMNPLTLNAPAMLIGSAVLLLATRATGEPLALPTTRAAWISILYLAIGGSAIAFLLYAWLLKQWDASRVTFVFLLTPPTALLLGTLLLDEPLTLGALSGAALVLLGVHAVSANARAGSPARGVRAAAAAVCATCACKP